MRRSDKLQTENPALRHVLPGDDPRERAILGPAAVHPLPPPGLIFAMDATASRQPSWDRAVEVQASMFSAMAPGSKVQLVYFRGTEFFASRWSRSPHELAAVMRTVTCVGGLTQIGYVLSHCERAAAFGSVSALVYVGDSMEEDSKELAALARKLADRRVACFMFQEGCDPAAAASFHDIAGLTKGAHCRLNRHSADELKDLLTAAAAYASGGRSKLLELAQHQTAARLLLAQLK